MEFLSTASGFFTAANGVWAVVCVLGVVVSGFVFRGTKAKNLVDLQDDTIRTLQQSNEAKDGKIAELEHQMAMVTGKMASMETEINVLRELVTNSAKVEVLRNEMHTEFDSLRAKLDNVAVQASAT